MRWKGKEQMDTCEAFYEELDRVRANQTDWLVNLQQIRTDIDDAYNAGKIAEYQWRALVTRSAKIQDEKNG